MPRSAPAAASAAIRPDPAGPVPRQTAPQPDRADAHTVWRPSQAVDARLTVSLLAHHRGDPCHRELPDGAVWRTSRMATGPVTYRIEQPHRGEITAHAWGPGAAELVGGLPQLLGADDDPADFEPGHPLLAAAHARFGGLRIPASGRILEALIPAILEQKVIGLDAAAAWRRLVARYGDPAPGPAPAGMRVPPTAAQWAGIPVWEWHRAGVEIRRARVAQSCAREADRLDRAAAAGGRDLVYRMLRDITGVGPWTAAQVGHRALGDADALPIGDFHLAAMTGWALAGRRLDEDEVEAFYEPWRPHRFRVVRLLELTPGALPPRRAPRLARQDFRRI
ncbi:MAG TPA: DNA-3-methyladenine glycosylase 2 family protein [Mycobacteriales bacterium]|nr:DNA-3-methyladenine glycosylase 2 family protein [Mycobacteriales bacterium]